MALTSAPAFVALGGLGFLLQCTILEYLAQDKLLNTSRESPLKNQVCLQVWEIFQQQWA